MDGAGSGRHTDSRGFGARGRNPLKEGWRVGRYGVSRVDSRLCREARAKNRSASCCRENEPVIGWVSPQWVPVSLLGEKPSKTAGKTAGCRQPGAAGSAGFGRTGAKRAVGAYHRFDYTEASGASRWSDHSGLSAYLGSSIRCPSGIHLCPLRCLRAKEQPVLFLDQLRELFLRVDTGLGIDVVQVGLDR